MNVYIALYIEDFQMKASNCFKRRVDAIDWGTYNEGFMAVVLVDVPKDKIVWQLEKDANNENN